MGQAARNLVYHPTHKGTGKKNRHSGSVLAAVRYAEQVRAKLELGLQLNCVRALNKLVALHTGRLWGIDGLEDFFSNLKAEPVRREFFMELLLELSKPQKFFGRSSARALVSEFLRWYVQRVRSLESFGETLESSNLKFADLKLSHDAIWAGYRGLRVSFSLALSGCAGTTIWAALSLEQEGRPVSCRTSWESWSLQVGPRLQLDSQKKPIAMGLVPLLIAEQNKIIDRAEVFLPYAALEIATNCRPTTVVLQLLSASGQALEEERIETTLGGFYRDEPVASPQTREVWGRDFETDSAIERTQLLICGKRYETLTLCVQALDSDDQEQIIFEQQISPNFSVQPVALPKVEAPSSAKFLEYFVKTADAQILCGSLEAVRAQSRD